MVKSHLKINKYIKPKENSMRLSGGLRLVNVRLKNPPSTLDYESINDPVTNDLDHGSINDPPTNFQDNGFITDPAD